MSIINLQDGYDLGYSYCKVCEDWARVEHDHEDKPLDDMTAEELVAMLPICPQCDKHGVMDGEMCTRCRQCRIEGCTNRNGWGEHNDLCMRHEDMLGFYEVARLWGR